MAVQTYLAVKIIVTAQPLPPRKGSIVLNIYSTTGVAFYRGCWGDLVVVITCCQVVSSTIRGYIKNIISSRLIALIRNSFVVINESVSEIIIRPAFQLILNNIRRIDVCNEANKGTKKYIIEVEFIQKNYFKNSDNCCTAYYIDSTYRVRCLVTSSTKV